MAEHDEKALEAENRPLAVTLTPPPDCPNGLYSNFVQIRMTEFDFILDFGQLVPPANAQEAEAVAESGAISMPALARVILPIVVVPRLTEALRRALEQYARTQGIGPRETATEKAQ